MSKDKLKSMTHRPMTTETITTTITITTTGETRGQTTLRIMTERGALILIILGTTIGEEVFHLEEEAGEDKGKTTKEITSKNSQSPTKTDSINLITMVLLRRLPNHLMDKTDNSWESQSTKRTILLMMNLSLQTMRLRSKMIRNLRRVNLKPKRKDHKKAGTWWMTRVTQRNQRRKIKKLMKALKKMKRMTMAINQMIGLPHLRKFKFKRERLLQQTQTMKAMHSTLIRCAVGRSSKIGWRPSQLTIETKS